MTEKIISKDEIMKSPSKVLLFTTNSVGGAERVTVIIGKYLKKSGYDIAFCVVENGFSTNSIRDFIPQGYSVETILDAHPVIMTAKLVSAIRRHKPDYVFASALYLNTKILPFRWLFPKTKFIIRSENNLTNFNRRQQWQMKWSYQMANIIVAQNQEMKDDMVNVLKIPSDKILVLLNPIDEEYIEEKLKISISPYNDAEHPVFVASGRFARQKGFDVLAKAFAIVHEHIPSSHLYLLGDTNSEGGKVYEEVKKTAIEYKMQDSIHYPGFQTNPYDWIKYADSFVLSSRYEGLPNVLIEALYLGVPAAATRCIPLISEIIKEGENGYLADVDDETSLADAMLKSVKLIKVSTYYSPASEKEFVNLFR